MPKKILVTGSQGTLGQKLVKELEGRGHIVTGCDLAHGEKNEIRADVTEARQVASVFKAVGPEVVYHLAAEFGRHNGQEYYEQMWKSNTLGTRNIIDACAQTGAHLVFASSSEVYGNVAESGAPVSEDSLLTTVPDFHNEYALSKYTNEKQIKIATANDGLKATILRFFNAYGPGEQYTGYRSVVCLFVYRLLNDLPITVYKDYSRVFMYVTDWARTVANVADRTASLEELTLQERTINVGGYEYISIDDLVQRMLKLIPNCKSQINELAKEVANITNKRPDNSRAETLLDHKCSVPLPAGLPLTVQWMKEFYSL